MSLRLFLYRTLLWSYRLYIWLRILNFLSWSWLQKFFLMISWWFHIKGLSHPEAKFLSLGFSKLFVNYTIEVLYSPLYKRLIEYESLFRIRSAPILSKINNCLPYTTVIYEALWSGSFIALIQVSGKWSPLFICCRPRSLILQLFPIDVWSIELDFSRLYSSVCEFMCLIWGLDNSSLGTSALIKLGMQHDPSLRLAKLLLCELFLHSIHFLCLFVHDHTLSIDFSDRGIFWTVNHYSCFE
jgi:hypothetical protein